MVDAETDDKQRVQESEKLGIADDDRATGKGSLRRDGSFHTKAERRESINRILPDAGSPIRSVLLTSGR